MILTLYRSILQTKALRLTTIKDLSSIIPLKGVHMVVFLEDLLLTILLKHLLLITFPRDLLLTGNGTSNFLIDIPIEIIMDHQSSWQRLQRRADLIALHLRVHIHKKHLLKDLCLLSSRKMMKHYLLGGMRRCAYRLP